MGHEVGKKDQGFTVNFRAWHTLFPQLNITSREDAERAVGIYEVEERPIFTQVLGGPNDGAFAPVETTEFATQVGDSGQRVEPKSVDGWKALFVKGTNDVLHVARNDYKLVQPSDLFDLADAIVSAGNATYRSGGSVRDRKRFWIMVKLNESVRLPRNGHEIQSNILFATGFDGTFATHMRMTPVDVVCANTLEAAGATGDEKKIGGQYSLDEHGIKIRHVGDQKKMLESALGALKLAHLLFENSAKALAVMSERDCNGEDLVEYLYRVMPDPKMPARFLNEKHEASFESRLDRARRARAKCAELAECGVGMDTSRGSLYAAASAVSEFADQWDAPNAKKPEARANKMIFDGGRALVKRAFQVAYSSL